MKKLRYYLFLSGIASSTLMFCQSTVEAEIDTAFRYEFNSLREVHSKAILVDQGHHTIYSKPTGQLTAREMFRIFEEDGFNVEFTSSPLHSVLLDSIDSDLLLIHGMPNDVQTLVNDSLKEVLYLSPMSGIEVASITKYVFNGGGLLVFLSHFPGGSGALPLMEAFGVKFRDGYAYQDDYHTSEGGICGHFFMNHENGMLNTNHDLFRSSIDMQTVPKSVRFYCGAAIFRNPEDVILSFPDKTINYTPTKNEGYSTEYSSRYAGMIGFEYGKGRVIICTDQGIFRSLNLFVNDEKVAVTIHDPESDNAGLLLNTIRWLTRLQ